MAVPKKKTSPSKRGQRRSHLALTCPVFVKDKKTNSLHRPHHVNKETGIYRDRQVMMKKELVDDEEDN